ncbi:putative quinol monooxygenase [Cryobacterium psychrophilum]|uniref:Antibiotic biosynthesis monooxygenase n=1 Tax=Cryobacterium psychrophilum TaxID=41988 RepID=A0A4Y8KRF5_9MICO|nr:putative quinol monooxygenase [Cryobacterium psychrophilum]TDW31213.1 quinol monooxygenase YgiN [Cryobacterium psychrophilum]TFD78494.1 antibiotic biosynthesis monooxygenase [Cryobacterium psychrophilum]
MSIIVIATLLPNPGRVQDALDAFAGAAPLVHEEAGCELYALHTDQSKLVMVERWATADDLAAHSTGDAMAELNRLMGDALTGAPEVSIMANVPTGVSSKGTIQ